MVFQGEFSITREKYKLYYVYIKGWPGFKGKGFYLKYLNTLAEFLSR